MAKINKEIFQGVSSHGMMWELQELQNIIKEKKNEAVQSQVDWYFNILMNYVKDIENTTERDFKKVLESLAKTVQQIEREV